MQISDLEIHLPVNNLHGWQGTSPIVERGDGCPVYKMRWTGMKSTHGQPPALMHPMGIFCLSDGSSFH